MKAIMQHELAKVCVVNLTDFDASADLGSPFTVLLHSGVYQTVDNGKTKITIPDMTGLFKTVVRSRVSHNRKLNGAELKFLRRAVGLQSKFVAQKMDVSPEHLSRCEAGAKVLSGSSEKIFRVLTHLASLSPDPRSIIAKMEAGETKKNKGKDKCDKHKREATDIVMRFMNMDIESVFSAEPLTLSFSLYCCEHESDTPWEAGEAA